jgi:hypothetical protein
MKNGRFSSKKTGKRSLSSTWHWSLSIWLKSGLTVASSVIVEVTPYLTLTPASPVASGERQARVSPRPLAPRDGEARDHREEERLPEVLEDDGHVRFEHPRARPHLGP